MEQSRLKEGPELVLNHELLYQLLSMPDFYKVLPAGLNDLHELGRNAHQEIVAFFLNPASCQTCAGLSKMILPFQTALGQRLSTIKQANPKALEPLAAMLAKKRGYRPKRIMLYYRDMDRTNASLSF